MDRVEIIFKNASLRTLLDLLIDYFTYEKSPVYPINVGYDIINLKREKPIGQFEFSNLRIEEATDDMDVSAKTFARVRLRSYNGTNVIIFDRAEDFDVTDDQWGKVVIIVKEILGKARQLGLDTLEINPKNLFEGHSKEDQEPWNKIEDRGNDRTILKLWWEGYTNSEILEILGKEGAPRTITNRISDLRRIYKEEIVPTAKTLRKLLIKNKS